MALLGVYDLVVTQRMLGKDYSTQILTRTDRSTLGFVYPIAFAIDLFVIVWLLQAGPTDRTALIRRAAGGCPGCSPDRS